MRYFITGGAGFIGSNLADRLLETGSEVTVYDNLSTGSERFLEKARTFSGFRFVKGDALDMESMTSAMRACGMVFHLAANADVRFGTCHPRRDLEQNTIATFNVLEAMRGAGIKRIAFSSTGSVYGEPDIFPTPENCAFPAQTSLYGASKLAGEGLIQAYCEGFGFTGYIFRLVSILGERYTHGHVLDFYAKLLANPRRLEILGDGKQKKSYLYVQDCISAMLSAAALESEKPTVYNIGAGEYCEINDSVAWITEALGLKPDLVYSGGKRGWAGDSPFIFLDTARIRSTGWKPRLTIKQAFLRTLAFLQDNRWVLERG